MQPVTPRTSVAEPAAPARSSWVRKLGSVLLIILCFEIGVFLLTFPWTQFWDHNSIASLAPWMRDLWDNSYFRGALSGLGVVNIYIAVAEAFHLRRPRPDRLKVPVL